MTGDLRTVTVELSGTDGNAFSILGTVRRALLDAGTPPDEVTRFVELAMTQKSYDALLAFLTANLDVR